MFKILLFSLSLISSSGCDKNKFAEIEKLKPFETYSLKISEPSDLTLYKNSLWIVSDKNETIYQTNLKGEIKYSFKINEADPEGIAVVEDSLLAITAELPRKIFLKDFSGKEISRFNIEIDGDKKSGLEGITFSPRSGHYYLINEKDPVLLIETERNFKIINKKEFEGIKDLSAVSYSHKENCLWLLSDEEEKIIKYSLKGKILKEYKINVQQPEGIAIDDNNNLIYVVSDKEEKLYVYKIR